MSDARETVSVPKNQADDKSDGRVQTEAWPKDPPTAWDQAPVTEPVSHLADQPAEQPVDSTVGTAGGSASTPAAPVKPVGARTGRVRTVGGTVRPARKARLRVAKLDPWSVMKVSLMFSIAVAVITFVAVALLWSVVEASGALRMLQDTLNALLGNPDGSGTVQVSAYIDRWRVLGFTAIVCGINVILLTALATLAAFLYNLSSSVLGGLEVTLAED
ncbi:MAG: DUF3566 domain-containing protein [Brooklawnia sp.]|uniref:DUF3566 domain-containing protein n=1 Tax=Brooklawnia sp. TaxID=2699740 RepID=UPI003C73ECE3